MNIKTAVVPISCFEDIKKDFTAFSKRDDLNGFQKWIVSDRYVLNPKLDFTPRSVVVCVAPTTLKNVEFTYGGKKYTSLVSVGVDTEKVKYYLSEGNNYQFFYDYWLPAKRTAVRCGLCEYGRNNICYADEFGSLITIFVFLSDMPSPDSYVWREVKNMDICEFCKLCEDNCPTHAMKPGRFLLENTICISTFNEAGDSPFPDFIPGTAHHSIVNCFLCQDICPANAGKFDNISETVIFSEEETARLLAGVKLEELPGDLAAKVKLCNMEWHFSAIPRNLKAMIKAADLREAGML